MNNPNNERIFRNLVAVEPRYRQSTKTNKERDLIVYTSFNEAIFGGKKDNKISFKLKLSKVEFFIIVDNNKLQIDEESILRINPSHKREIEEKQGKLSQKSLGGSLDLSANPKVGIKADNKENLATERTQRYEAGRINYDYHPVNKNEPRWILKPYSGETYLQGSVWGDDEKLLTFIDNGTSPNHLASSARLIIQCRRENLHIIDIQCSNDSGIYYHFSKQEKIDYKNELIAIEEIKDFLIEHGLADKNLSSTDILHKHAIIKIADIPV